MSEVIQLTQGWIALVDPPIYPFISVWNWWTELKNKGQRRNPLAYARGRISNDSRIFMHRKVLDWYSIEVPYGMVVHHKTHMLQKYKIIDNRLSNLEVVTPLKNSREKEIRKGYCAVERNNSSIELILSFPIEKFNRLLVEAIGKELVEKFDLERNRTK